MLADKRPLHCGSLIRSMSALGNRVRDDAGRSLVYVRNTPKPDFNPAGSAIRGIMAGWRFPRPGQPVNLRVNRVSPTFSYQPPGFHPTIERWSVSVFRSICATKVHDALP
jgi:hypothetical protein